ncbi:ferrous iron transport protein B [Timonella senegalensis]|uniref:ferrous iron transport protein B n=1 Tax=Timonella senegalensis TaxID=1465825 RepID=UPI002FE4018A
MTCHDTGDGSVQVGAGAAGAGAATATLPLTDRQIILVGRPNVGKSTLFNLLTGSHQKTMNVPRTTVSVEVGTWALATGERVSITDLPGTYSLNPTSPDEEVTAHAVDDFAREIAAAEEDSHRLAVVVLDATALGSSLYLYAQTRLSGVPVVVALSMNDMAAASGTSVDPERLARALGAPVVPINPRLGRGAAELEAALDRVDRAPSALIPLPIFDDPAATSSTVNPGADPAAGVSPSGVSPLETDEELERAHTLFGWVREVLEHIQPADEGQDGSSAKGRATPSDRLDRFLLRPLYGIPVFLAVLWATFQLTTTISGPIQDWLEGLVTGPLTSGVSGLLELASAPRWLMSLTVDGLIAGVGTVVSFLPLMAIIFTMIFLLEDSGYLARVAVMADRAMQSLGLDGRAVLPLVIGFGCNIPALTATKTIPDARQRLLTGLLIPYSSCTARLVIYLLLASVFFPGHAGTVVFAMYIVSALVILGVAYALRKTAFRSLVREPLVIVLPAYQTPRFGSLGRAVALRCSGFARRAGVVILALSMGAASSAIAPIFEPAGFGDWHISASLITGFVAKEAVVGTLATTYGMDEPAEGVAPRDLSAQLHATFDASSSGYPALAAAAFMVFCLVYTPCMVTVAEQKRLFGAKITAASVGGSILLAWLLAVGIFQIGRLFL